jgi:hypothetical protein
MSSELILSISPDAAAYFGEPHLVTGEVPEEWRR